MKFAFWAAFAAGMTIAKASSAIDFDKCIFNCSSPVCPDGLSNNTTCICVTQTNVIFACIEANCTADDLFIAQHIRQMYCGNLSSSAASTIVSTSLSVLVTVMGTASANTTANATKSASSSSISITPNVCTSLQDQSRSEVGVACTNAVSTSGIRKKIISCNGGLAGVLGLIVALTAVVCVIA